jgi:hypothetical protein
MPKTFAEDKKVIEKEAIVETFEVHGAGSGVDRLTE